MKKFTKEQLENTYIVNDFGVLRDAYVKAVADAGVFNENFNHETCKDKYIAAIDRFPVMQNIMRDSSLSGLTKLHPSDLIDLENSKVYTTDPEVVRKYAELCGKGVVGANSESCGFYSATNNEHVRSFCSTSNRDSDSGIHEITVDQVNALHREKFPEQYDKPKTKPRKVVEYVKVDMETNDIAKAMIDGEEFYNKSGTVKYFWSGDEFANDEVEADVALSVTTTAA